MQVFDALLFSTIVLPKHDLAPRLGLTREGFRDPTAHQGCLDQLPLCTTAPHLRNFAPRHGLLYTLLKVYTAHPSALDQRP